MPIVYFPDLASALSVSRPDTSQVVLTPPPRGTVSVFEVPAHNSGTCLWVGPEAGWSPAEEDLFDKA
jgi:16S rRNA U1498 N3-methylase RsmE